MSDERRAIEALRAGVPNRVAIRLLGTAETTISERFVENLQCCKTQLNEGGQATGQVIAGGFGTGKSHLLGYLQYVALKENFIVSWVIISKETPLFDLGKLYVSAIRNATVPKHNDDAMTAVLSKFGSKSDAYDELLRWAESVESGLSPLFAGLLYLLPHPNTYPERVQQIARFFAGDKLSLATVRQWLREVDAVKRFLLTPIKHQDLIEQRVCFVPRLIAAAGYSGWVLLLDEVELIGRYSRLQRARSYAELARWLGLDVEERASGVMTVAAITDDFTSEVIRNRRDDEHAPKILSDKNERKAAERARLGITTLMEQQVLLQTPTAELLQDSLNKIRGFYSAAYGWDATAVTVGDITTTKSMRQYIKSWITRWDLDRLYGIRPEIETVDIASDYEENKDIEQATAKNGDDPDNDS